MSLIISGSAPKTIMLGGTSVKEVWFGGKKIWPVTDTYIITGTVFGKARRTIDDCGGRDCDPSNNCNCNCRNVLDDYTYKIQITFSGVYKFPIKYVSKSGATVTINQNQVSGSGTTYTYTSGYLQNSKTDESYNNNEGINTVKSLYPSSGVSGYSSIASINIEAKNEGISECDRQNHNCNCSSGGGGDCDDCQGDADGQCD